MLDDINKIHPGAGLEWNDISFIHSGLLPRQSDSGQEAGHDTVQLEKSTRIIDHLKSDGVEGIISISGVKYTTAPTIACKLLHMLRKKGHSPGQAGSYTCSARTGPPLDHTALIRDLGHHYDEIKHHLVSRYTTHWRNVLDHIDLAESVETDDLWLSAEPPLLKAEVLYFIKQEQAVTLTDVVLRRSSLGTAQCPPEAVIKKVAGFMSHHLGWSVDQCNDECEQLYDSYFPLIPERSSEHVS